MALIRIQLEAEADGAVRIAGAADGTAWRHCAGADEVRGVQQAVAECLDRFEAGTRPLSDPVELAELGVRLRDTFLPSLYGSHADLLRQAAGQFLFTSGSADLLNLPWELLPGPDGQFLVADARWAIRRTIRSGLPEVSLGLVAPPLRILFVACAPIDLAGLDYEKEEETILRIADRLGGSVYLEIAEAGTFDELRDLVSEVKPHVVHLSGHGKVRDGAGYFAFENDSGRTDERDAREMAEVLFAGRGVRLVFVSGCQSARAGAAGVCQTLTATGHVPLALGWGASIGDFQATEFARGFYHELAAGQPVDRAVSLARRELLGRGRFRAGGLDLLDASFALPQLHAADGTDRIVDSAFPPERPDRPGVRYVLLGDNIRGLREGFVGRRRVSQRTRPALRSGATHVLLLTGIGGAGKSTLATRLANRARQDGFRIVAVRARRDEPTPFCLRLLGELAAACQRLGREADERMLRDGERPIADRLRLAVEVLNEARILLVLDNLEALMPLPPAPPAWSDADFAGFFGDLLARLTGEGRAILTCRYVPKGFDPSQPNLAHEPLPDFTEGDFFKYLRRHEKVAARIDRGELSQAILSDFHRKLGATPRFVEQAAAVLAQIDPDDLKDQLDGVEEGLVHESQQSYFRDLFLPQLCDALDPRSRTALSRLALVEVPLPLDGVARVASIRGPDAQEALADWLGLGLIERFGEPGEVPLYAVYSLQRDFFTHPDRLTADHSTQAHAAAAAFLQDCYEKEREQDLRLPVVVEVSACLSHAMAAGDQNRRAWAANMLAGRLNRFGEFRAAVDLLAPIVAEHPTADVLETSACAIASLGDWQHARVRFEQALSVRQAIGDRAGEAVTWAQLGTIDVNEGDYAAAREKLGKALAMLQAIGSPADEAAAWHNLASIDLKEGNYAAAREKLGKALAMHQAIGNWAGEATTWHQLATIDLYEGNYAAARKKFGKVLAMHQAIGNRAGEATTWHQLATIDLYEGKYAAARKRHGKAFSMRQAIGDRAGEAATWHSLATIDLNEGDYAAAREKFGKAVAIEQVIGDRTGEASTWHQLATVDLNEGNYAAARAKFGKALAMRQVIGDRAGEAATWHNLATIDLNEGNYAAAREKFGKALLTSESIGDRAGEAATWHNLATIDLNEGDYAAAREKFGKALAMLQAIGDRAVEAVTLHQIGVIAWENGRRGIGIRLVAVSLGMLQAIGSGSAEKAQTSLAAMAAELGLDQVGFEAFFRESAAAYQQDRGASLVQQAFEGL